MALLFQVYHRSGVDMVNADFLSSLANLPNATPSEAAKAEPLDQVYPLPYPLNQMQEEFNIMATGGAYAP